MRVLVFASLALALAGCDHMYGGFDGGRLAPAAAREDRTELVKIAMRKLAREDVTLGGPPTVIDAGSNWRVRFGPDSPNVLDGGVTVEIDKKSRRAVRYWFDS